MFVELVVFNLCVTLRASLLYCSCLVSEYVLCSINSTLKMVDDRNGCFTDSLCNALLKMHFGVSQSIHVTIRLEVELLS